jgi:hypothetical protein
MALPQAKQSTISSCVADMANTENEFQKLKL